MVAWVVINRQHPPAALFALPSALFFPLSHLSPLLPTPYALLSATAAPQPLCNQSVTHSFCLDGGCAPGYPLSPQKGTKNDPRIRQTQLYQSSTPPPYHRRRSPLP